MSYFPYVLVINNESKVKGTMVHAYRCHPTGVAHAIQQHGHFSQRRGDMASACELRSEPLTILHELIGDEIGGHIDTQIDQ